MAICISFAKFAKIFPLQNFPTYGIQKLHVSNEDGSIPFLYFSYSNLFAQIACLERWSCQVILSKLMTSQLLTESKNTRLTCNMTVHSTRGTYVHTYLHILCMHLHTLQLYYKSYFYQTLLTCQYFSEYAYHVCT